MHFPVAHYMRETEGLAAYVTSFSGCTAVRLTHQLSKPSHCKSNSGHAEEQADCIRQLHPTSNVYTGQETNRSKLGGPEQMAFLAEPMAETYEMPGNWFQQDFLRSVAKG